MRELSAEDHFSDGTDHKDTPHLGSIYNYVLQCRERQLSCAFPVFNKLYLFVHLTRLLRQTSLFSFPYFLKGDLTDSSLLIPPILHLIIAVIPCLPRYIPVALPAPSRTHTHSCILHLSPVVRRSHSLLSSVKLLFIFKRLEINRSKGKVSWRELDEKFGTAVGTCLLWSNKPKS